MTDSEAMKLVKKFELSIERVGQATPTPYWIVRKPNVGQPQIGAFNSDLNRAIRECVIKIKK